MIRISQREAKVTSNAIILDGSSKRALKEMFPGKHANYHGDHITLDFGVNQYHKDFGKKVTANVIGYAKDDKAEAALVTLNGVQCDKPYPHVTISTAPGVSAKYSNELLAKGHEGEDAPLVLHGTVGAYVNGKYVTEKV